MNADHRRPLFAFFVVASVCALLIGQGVRTNGDFLDYLVGKNAVTQQSVAKPATLEVRPDTAAPDRGSVGSPHSADGDGNGPRAGGDAQPGQAQGLNGNPGKANGHDKGSRGGGVKSGHSSVKGHGSHARTDAGQGDKGGKAKGHGKGGKAKGHDKGHKGKGKGHDKNHPGHSNPGKGHVPH